MEREEVEMSEEVDALNTWWTLVHNESEDTNEMIDDAQASITVCTKEGRHPVKMELKPALKSKTKSRRRSKSPFPGLTRTKSSTKSVSWDDEEIMKKTHLEEAEKLRLDLLKKKSKEVSLFDIERDESKEEDRNDSISITTEYVHKVEGGGDDEKRCGGLGLSSAGLESVWTLFCAAADGVDGAINNMGNNDDSTDIIDTSGEETETISKDESQKDLHAFSTELANAWSTLCQALPDTSAEETETVVKDESQKNLQDNTSINNAKSEGGNSLDVSTELANAWSTLCQALPSSKNDDGLLKDSTSAAEVEKDTNEKYWRATVDSTTNKTYYYNKKTREVSWTKPEGFGHCDEHWRSAKDLSTGKTYYYHKKTKEVSWTKPDGFKERKKRV